MALGGSCLQLILKLLDLSLHPLQSSLVMSNSLRPCGLQHTRLPCPSPTSGACSNSSIESVMPSNHLILCRPLLLLSIFPSIKVLSSELALPIRWSKYWIFNHVYIHCLVSSEDILQGWHSYDKFKI